MKNIIRHVSVKSTQTILDLFAGIVLFLIIIAPLVYYNFPDITQQHDIYLSSTGFYIPDLLSDSLYISLKLIFCSLAISGYFGLCVSLTGTFSRRYYWLPSLFVIISTIPIFITAYYLPYILFVVFVFVLFLSMPSLGDKPFIPLGISAVLIALSVVAISYASKIGYLDIMSRAKPVFMPDWIWGNFGSITGYSIIVTENIMPVAGIIFISLVFLVYYKKYPLNASLIITLASGALAVYAIIIYGYRTQVEDTYLLGPILTLSVGNLVLGLFINQIQAGITEELQHDYIKAAVAKGASVWNHLSRKILLIVLNTLKSQFALLLSLTIVVEKIYNLEGIGYLAWEYATQEADFVTVAWIMGLCFVLVWVFNTLMDIAIFFLSPHD